MWSPQEAVAAITAAGFTHVVWIPDSFFGAWDEPLSYSLPLIRVTREGEAIGLAAGLLLGQARPLVILQSTGFFEAGDALRNAVYDLQLPLKLLIGLRSYRAWKAGHSQDSAARFAEAAVQAWQLPYQILDPQSQGIDTLAAALRQLNHSPNAAALLIME
jgi:sulfopyruvate decarboxylase TPP-binding subunit